MNENIMMDENAIAETAEEYAMEHEKVVNDNFGLLYDLLVASLNDETFQERLENLKTRGRVNIDVLLKPQDNLICFAKKMWFIIRRNTSEYRKWYYVDVGVDLNETDINMFGYNNVWIARVAKGELDDVRKQICSEGFKENLCERLKSCIYEVYYRFVKEYLSPDTDLSKFLEL